MYVDLWQWIYDYTNHVSLKGDTKGIQLALAVHDGLRYRQDGDADNALRTLESGVKLAHDLTEPCGVMFCQFWIADILFYFKYDYQVALDDTIRITIECRKEKYENCPVRSAIFFLLADIYYTVDFYGYESQILDLLEYIETDVQMDEDTHLRLLQMRAQIDYEHRDLISAEKKSNDILNRPLGQHPYRQHSSFNLLHKIAYAQGNISLALDYNRYVLNIVEEIQMQLLIGYEKLWQAVYLNRIGESDKAHQIYLASLEHYEQYNLAKGVVFHEASSEYMELQGDVEQAIELRRALVEQVMTSASIYNQMIAHWNYCRILGRFAKPMETALASARAISKKSLNPTIYLQKLDEIEAGNYWEFNWQKEK